MHSYYTFLKCVAEGTVPSPGLEEGARLQRLMDLMVISDREKRWVAVD